MYIEKIYPFLNSFFQTVLIILKPPHENNECHELKTQEVLRKASLCFVLMDVYQLSNDSSDHEFLLGKLKFTVCLIQYSSSSVLNETLSRQYFPWKMKQCKNCYTSVSVQAKQKRYYNNNKNNDNDYVNDDNNNSNNNSNNDKNNANNSSSNNNK